MCVSTSIFPAPHGARQSPDVVGSTPPSTKTKPFDPPTPHCDARDPYASNASASRLPEAGRRHTGQHGSYGRSFNGARAGVPRACVIDRSDVWGWGVLCCVERTRSVLGRELEPDPASPLSLRGRGCAVTRCWVHRCTHGRVDYPLPPTHLPPQVALSSADPEVRSLSQSRATTNGRVGATAAVYSAAILGAPLPLPSTPIPRALLLLRPPARSE